MSESLQLDVFNSFPENGYLLFNNEHILFILNDIEQKGEKLRIGIFRFEPENCQAWTH